MAEWLVRRTHNLAVQGSSSALAICWICSRSSRVQILGNVFLKIVNWLPFASRGFLCSVWIIFSDYFGCTRRSDSRARCEDRGKERVKSCAEKTWGKTRGDWGKCFFFPRQFFARALASEPLEQAKIT